MAHVIKFSAEFRLDALEVSIQKKTQKGHVHMIPGVGASIKNPLIKNYPTTNLLKETSIKITRLKLLKIIKNKFEKKLKRFALNG